MQVEYKVASLLVPVGLLVLYQGYQGDKADKVPDHEAHVGFLRGHLGFGILVIVGVEAGGAVAAAVAAVQ